MPRLAQALQAADAAHDPVQSEAQIALILSHSAQLSEDQLLTFVQAARDVDLALRQLHRFCETQAAALQQIAAQTEGLRVLSLLFSHSEALGEDVLRHPEWVVELLKSGWLHRSIGPGAFEARLRADMQAQQEEVPSSLLLATFRRRQMVRILLRDVTGLATLPELCGELSAMADAILQVTYASLYRELVGELGVPPGANREATLAIIALGKLGGEELNYSSDIDLLYVYSVNGDGPHVSNKEFFKKLANRQTELLSAYTAHGVCYRVDLRLRPDGRLGDVAMSMEGGAAYYRNRARDWELQMLIKGRAAAGDLDLGRQFLAMTEPLTYATTLDFKAVEAVAESRERIHEKSTAKGPALNVKLAPGGIRDIEFLVQCLQRLHGGREPWVRHGGTLLALSRLRDKDLLSMQEYAQLSSAYEFFRHLEHRLQVMHDRQTHSLPTLPVALHSLARRMPSDYLGGVETADRLQERLAHHLAEVREIYARVIDARLPATASSRSEQMADSGSPLEGLNDEGLRRLDGDEGLRLRVVDVCAHSTHFAELLRRHPELLDEVAAIDEPYHRAALREASMGAESAGALRRMYLRSMFRIQSASLCLPEPVFVTLQKMSDLADSMLMASYELARAQVLATDQTLPAHYHATNQLMVIALGRLGMREFDLASDADLVFVLPDQDECAHVFWTRVAEKIIEILTAYTSEGSIFAVDTRLRPNGRAGRLVQLENTYKQYFDSVAEPWEGISYLKSRAVAGDVERATDFLHRLQEIDWRRCGQSLRSKASLRQMRARIEKEQGAAQRLKSGPGAFYDIDFILMYLRLKGAGMFFPVLNTPQRIDVVEKMGHLDREDAEFLRQAATYFRAIDHALRLYSGHSASNLPASPAVRSLLAEMVIRWTPGPQTAARVGRQDTEETYEGTTPLDRQLATVQRQTRAVFDRIFE